MRVKYEGIIKVKIMHEIESLENLKDCNEFFGDLIQMISDEVVMCDGVAVCDVLESEINVK